jgi:adenylate cyclase
MADIAAAAGMGTETRAGDQLTRRMALRLATEEEAGRRIALRGRSVALAAVGLLLLALVPYPQVLYYEALLAVFLLLGFAGLSLQNSSLHRWWQDYLLITLDFALIAFTLIYPNPLSPVDYPPQLALRTGNFVYFYVLLVGLGFGLRPSHVLWGGASGALAWAVGVAWLASLPTTILLLPPSAESSAMTAAGSLPTVLDLAVPLQDIAVFLIIAVLIALMVARARRLVLRQAMLERERANLARYFPPATVDRLARQDTALAQVREQNVAVLFADIVGFTHWSEAHAPAEVIRLLREVHARLAEAVFRHDGTLDKFIGDGMMATFGTPDPGPRDASSALACVRDIIAGFDDWNERRGRAGQRPARISVGLHYGRVVVGNIGTDRRLEPGVLGDTVNVAKRLEAITRDLGCKAVISVAVAEAVMHESADAGREALTGFTERGPQALRGRDEQVPVLSFG